MARKQQEPCLAEAGYYAGHSAQCSSLVSRFGRYAIEDIWSARFTSSDFYRFGRMNIGCPVPALRRENVAGDRTRKTSHLLKTPLIFARKSPFRKSCLSALLRVMRAVSADSSGPSGHLLPCNAGGLFPPALRHVCRLTGWGGRDRTSECRNQNPVPYRLATPHRRLQVSYIIALLKSLPQVGAAPRCRRGGVPQSAKARRGNWAGFCGVLAPRGMRRAERASAAMRMALAPREEFR